METRILMRFIGIKEDLDNLCEEFLQEYPEAELFYMDSTSFYKVDEIMLDEYECRFEELPETELFAIDGSFIVDENPPEDFLNNLMEKYEHVYGVFKWSSMDVGIGCGISEAWGEFNQNFYDDGSDEANEISEAVLGF